MADVDALTVGVQADVASFLKGMEEVKTKIESTVDGLQKLSDGAKKAGEAHEESAGAIGMAVEGYHLAAEAVAKVVEGLSSFAEAAIDAANEMDPAGAIAWTKSIEGVKAAFGDFAGSIGKVIRPEIESIANAMAGVFLKLSKLDWGEVGRLILEMLRSVGSGIETWATAVLDLMSKPFRLLIGTVEAVMAGVMNQIGGLLNAIGGTSIGQKLGIGAGAGDAFKGTADDMVKQADRIEASFKGAMGEVGKGLEVALDAAIKNTTAGADMKKLADMAKGVLSGSDAGKAITKTPQQLAAEVNAYLAQQKSQADGFKDQEQADQRHIAAIRQAASEQKQSAMDAFNLAKQKLSESQQQLSNDQGSGNLGAIAADRQAVAAALKAMNDAGAGAAKAATDAATAETGLAADLANRAAIAQQNYGMARAAAVKADADAASAPGSAELQAVKTEMDARAAMLESQKDILVSQYTSAEQAASRLRAQSTREAAAIGLSAAQEESKIRMAAAKQAADFYGKTIAHLGQAALGGVGGGALAAGQAGFAAAGPMGAAVGAGASLLESSAGFKKVSDAINKIMQSVADTLGRFLEPLVPVIESIGNAIKPFLDALGAVFGAAGKGLAAALTPLVPVIKVVAGLLADILEPISELMNAIQPLIPIIVMVNEVLLAISLVGFAPLIIAIKALRPVIDFVAGVISKVVDGIVGIWNGIIDAVASVFDALAHALPGGAGDTMRQFYYDLEGMKAQTTEQAAAMQALSDTLGELTQAAHDGTLAQVALTSAQRTAIEMQINALRGMAATDAANGWTDAATMASNAAAQLAVDLNAAGNAAAPGIAAAFDKVIQDVQKVGADRAKLSGDQQAINDFAKSGNHGAESAAVAQYFKDLQQTSLDALQQALDTATAQYQAGSGSQQAVLDAQQALTEAQIESQVTNTGSTTANTHATQALTASLTNMVSGFRVGAYDQGGGGSFGALGGQVGGGGIVIYGDIHVTDPDLGKAIQKHVAKSRRGMGRGG